MKITKKQLENLDNDELVQVIKKLQEVEEAQKTRTLDSYFETANAGQVQFHKAAVSHRIRYLFGSNRSGKSTAGFVEDIWLALGRHPFVKSWRVPAKGLVVVQDFENHAKNILEPKFKEWSPAGTIIKADRNQNGAWRKIYFQTGSTIDILSHDQDKKVFEGSDYDWAHFDEPPPKEIFNAVWRGLTDRGGIAFLTGTPLMSPWLYKEFKLAESGDPLRWAIIVNMLTNAKNIGGGDIELGKKRIAEFESMLDPDERAARIDGGFAQMRGLIFKNWNRDKMVPEFDWPVDWPIWESIDPHPHKPYAVAWIGITENGSKVLLRSGLFEGVIEEVGQQILHERTQIRIKGSVKPKIIRCLIDNAASVPIWSKSHTDPTAKRISVREELENIIGPRYGGPRIEVAPKNVKGKIDIYKQWLHNNEFFAFDIAENERFIYEIENYVWDIKRGGLVNGLKDQPRKVDDDILDAIMQVALTMPRIDLTDNIEPIKAWKASTWKV